MNNKFPLFSLLLGGILWFILPESTFAQEQTVIPLDTTQWEKVSCGSWATSGDSLIIYGTDYRVPGIVESKDLFDLSKSEIYIKWKVDDAGKFMAVTLSAGGYALGKLATTDHSCCNSIVIQSGKWYYTQVKFHADTSFTAIRSTGNFYDNGGVLLDSLRKEVTPKCWYLAIKNGKIGAMIHDNYGGNQCSLTLGYVLLKNAVKRRASDIIATQTFNFEDGKIPPEIKQDTNSAWTIADTGYQSNKSVFLEQTPGNASWIEINVNHATKVSFDARYISGYTWNAIMSASFAIDTLNMVTFDRSNMGCWHHFEWLLPDARTHNLRWYSSYSGTYPQDNSKLWIDNITIDYTDVTGVPSHEKMNVTSVRCFPNPFSEKTIIGYKLTKPAFVRIEIYNLTGQRIKKLSEGRRTAGTFYVKWDASGIAPGTYFCKISTDNGFIIKKLILEK